MHENVKTSNTILYCKEWQETVEFYRDKLKLPIIFSTDWFVEFRLNAMSRLSIANEKRASIKSCGAKGITLAMEVDDIESARTDMKEMGSNPTEIRKHPWDARVFYLLDPEGHRIEIWQSISNRKA